MATTILVPTDLRIASLNCVKMALESHLNAEQVHILLMHPMHLESSITGLLFYSQADILRSKVSPEFTEALEIIKNRFSTQILGLRIKLFHGRTSSAFDRFLVANKIDQIFVPENYHLRLSSDTFDPLPLILKCPCPHTKVVWPESIKQSEQEELTALFI